MLYEVTTSLRVWQTLGRTSLHILEASNPQYLRAERTLPVLHCKWLDLVCGFMFQSFEKSSLRFGWWGELGQRLMLSTDSMMRDGRHKYDDLFRAVS